MSGSSLGAGVIASVFPSLHSSLWTGSQGAGAGEACIGDLGLTWQEREARMKALGADGESLDRSAFEHLIDGAAGDSDRGDGGTLMYVFETPEGSLLFQDTSGHWGAILRALRPDVAILAAAGRATVDGEPVQGSLADFLVGEARDLQARRVVLGHHDIGSRVFPQLSTLNPSARPSRNVPRNRAPGARLPGCHGRLRRERPPDDGAIPPSAQDGVGEVGALNLLGRMCERTRGDKDSPGEPVGHDVSHLGVAPAEGVVAVHENQGDGPGMAAVSSFYLVGCAKGVPTSADKETGNVE